MRRVRLAACLLVVPVVALAGDIFRWRDARGQIHFSELPPPGVTAERVTITADSGAGSSPNLEELQAYNGANAAERDATAEAAAEDEKTLAERRSRCRGAQERLARLATRSPVRWATRDAQGNFSRMTEEQYRAEQDKARREMQDSCDKSS